VERNPPQVHCTAKGYMKMSTSGWNSRGKGIEKQVMELAQEHPLANVPGEDRLNAIYSWVYETRDTMHADAMGDVNWVSDRMIKRIHVSLHPGSGVILLYPMKLGVATHFALEAAITRLQEAGERVTEVVIDNVVGEPMAAYLERHGKTVNIVPPYVHRSNKAEAAIDMVRCVLVAMLAGADPDFRREDWDLMTGQAELILNLLRAGRDGKSAYETLYKKKYDWIEHPMGIFGCRVEAWVPKAARTTLGAKTRKAFYIAPALNHYRCVKVICPGTKEMLITDNVVWFPSVVAVPGKSRLMEMTEALDNFQRTLLDNQLIVEDNRKAQLKDLMEIIKKKIEEGESENIVVDDDDDEAGPVQLTEEIDSIINNENSIINNGNEERSDDNQNNAESRDDAASEGEPETEAEAEITQAKKPVKKKRSSTKRSNSNDLQELDYLQPKPYTARVRNRLNKIVAISYEECQRQQLYSIVTTEGKLTYEKALLSVDGKEWANKMEQELDRLIEKTETAEAIHYREKKDNKRPTYASVVLEQKPGKEKRIRMVFGGHMQEENPIWTSRNTDMAAKKLFLNKVVSEGLKFMTLDIKDFYLAEMNVLDEPEYMVVKEKILTEKYKLKYRDMIKNGMLLLRLKRPIYGMKQAGYISQRNLIKVLETEGYTETDYHCIYTNRAKSVTFVTHVDDFGVGYRNKKDVERLIEVLQKAGYTITIDWEGLKFCGMEIKLVVGVTIDVSVRETIKRIRTRFGDFKPRDCPYLISQMNYSKEQLEQEMDESESLNEKDKKILQEKIGLLRYIANAVFVHLELAVGKIAANMAKPTVKLMEQADHVLGYLQNNADRALRYYPSDMILRAHSDASYGCEANFRCRTGGYIFCGSKDPNFINGPIEVISIVQKNNVTCTAEAEYVAVFDVAQRLAYFRKLAEALGYPQGAIVIECDNECAVGLANNLSHERKTRHIAMRYHWIRDQVSLDMLDVIWRKNTYNVADFATKRMRTKEEYLRGRDIFTVKI